VCFLFSSVHSKGRPSQKVLVIMKGTQMGNLYRKALVIRKEQQMGNL
jgi:hypothetical protein